jgi:hypothetical protein
MKSPRLGKRSALVAERVKRIPVNKIHVPEVQPLNEGFFALERLRAADKVQRRGQPRAKLRTA